MIAQVKTVTSLILSDAHYVHTNTFWYLHMKKFLKYFCNYFWLTNAWEPKSQTITLGQPFITQQYIVQFTQTKYQNLPLSILFTLLDSNKAQKIFKKNPLFSNFWLGILMVPIHGQENFSNTLGIIYHQYTFTGIKILKLCTILLCSTQGYLIQEITFWLLTNKETSNKGHHSNQSPPLKFSPNNCLYFLNIHPSAEFNHLWVTKSHLYNHNLMSPCWPIGFWP